MAMKRPAHNRFSRWLCASEPSCNCYHYCYHRLRGTGSAGGGLAKQRRRASEDVAAVGDEEEYSYYPSVVRTVLAGGVVELYSTAVAAREVMERHPGLCVARPEVFSRPLEALVGAREKLLPGEKFYLVPYTTVRKLKQRQRPRRSGVEGGGVDEGHLDLKAAMAADKGGAEEGDREIDEDEDEDEKVLSAKDFYVSRERWRQCVARRRLLWQAGRRESSEQLLRPPPPPPPPPPPTRQLPQVGRGSGRGFVPLRRRKVCRKKGLGWKPNLESIQEVSP